MRTSSFGLFLALVLLAGCGGGGGGGSATPATSTPTTSTATLGGTYLGTNTDSVGGAGSIGVNIVQSGTSLSGTMGLLYASAVEVATLSGSVNGATSATLTITPVDVGFCPGVLTATIPASGQVTTWTGSYIGTNCSSGTFSLTLATTLPNASGTFNAGTVTGGGLSGTLKATIAQTSGGVLSGSWASTFTNPANNNSGSVNGMIVRSNAAVFYLISSLPNGCPFAAAATLGVTPITGAYGTIAGTCSVAQTGTFTLQ